MKLRNTALILTQLLIACVCSFNTLQGADAATDLPLLHPLFADHMVLQRGVKVPVWGWARPGTKITVNFAGQTKSATAQADGKWMVRLNSMPFSAEPRVLKVTSSD